MPPNRQINKGLSDTLKTLGYNQMAKDALKIKSKDEFMKYSSVTRKLMKGKANAHLDILEQRY